MLSQPTRSNQQQSSSERCYCGKLMVLHHISILKFYILFWVYPETYRKYGSNVLQKYWFSNNPASDFSLPFIWSTLPWWRYMQVPSNMCTYLPNYEVSDHKTQ